ncbi:MAG TPA: cytochrome c biogenesis protein CcdA [Candidatus Paceibacterota bacterium]|nr:cytochrome c biogenesis protein CcdA [Candidatus Paceibacterota bacterium]
MRKTYTIAVATILVFGLFVFFRFTESGQNLLWSMSDGGTLLLPLITVAALIDSINPCAFSILLLTIAFLVGLGGKTGQILKIGGTYILGLFVVYILIGLGILNALHLFNTPHFMAKVGAAILIVWGVFEIVGEFFPRFPVKLKIPDAAHHKIADLMAKASLPAAFAMGMLVGLCEFPCTGGPYLMVLGLLHDAGTYVKGLGYLLFYNIIFVLPLVIILFIASHEGLLDKVRDWQRRERRLMRFGAGAAMVVLGLLLFVL